MKKTNQLGKRLLAGGLSAVLALSTAFIASPTAFADSSSKVNTDKWRKSISIDFGISKEINGITSKVPSIKETTADDGTKTVTLPQLIPNAAGYDTYSDVAGDMVQGYGTTLYENTTVQGLYNENDDIDTKQKIGFDRVLPAAITSGGEYFNDWVFSPNGEAYKFSVDLPVGQYYVCVYTGNKLKEKDNTTFINFNDEKNGDTNIVYDQTSIGSQQFYGPAGNNNVTRDNKYIYSVDIADNGSGYGTLTVNLSDPELKNEKYNASHSYTIENALKDIEDFNNYTDEEKANYKESSNPRIKALDFYEDSANAINSTAIKDSLITARLNGIEIVPVKEAKHMDTFSAPEKIKKEIVDAPSLLIDGLDAYTDRVVFGSSNPEVASVNVYTGEVTPVSAGKTTITAYNAHLKQAVQTEYTVTPETVVNLDKNNIILLLDSGDEQASDVLKATFNVADADVIDWSVDKSDIISLGESKFTKGDENSTSEISINALKAGSATITATRTDTNKTAKCTVNVVKPVKSFVLSKEDGTPITGDTTINMNKNDALTIKSEAAPADASDKTINYTSSNKSVVTVTAKGDGALLSAVGTGEAVITCEAATNSDAKVTFKVVVTEPVNKPADNNTATPAPSVTSQPSAGNTASPSTDGSNTTSASNTSIKLTGKSKITIKIKKAATFIASAKGSKISKISYKIKSGKKMIKVKVAKKKSVKITAKKKGKAKIVITIKTKDGTTKKFTRTITIK